MDHSCTTTPQGNLGSGSYGAFLLLMGALWLTTPAQSHAQTAPGNAVTGPPAAHAQARPGRQVHVSNAEGAAIHLWKPDLERIPLEAKHGAVAIPSSGVDNYHALVLTRDWGDDHQSIIRYEYMRGKPSGESPSKLLNAPKSPLELVPDPLPREHQRYESGTRWDFILRLHEQPLPATQVSLETTNGSRLTALSDPQGRVRFTLPEDFADITAGEKDRRQAGFTLSAQASHQGSRYHTQLSADYRVNPRHWQSFELGLLFVVLGLVSGGLIGRIGLSETGKNQRKV